MKITIKKTAKSSWQGNGFGTSRASYGVTNRPDIRVVRASHGWTAYVDGQKFFGLTKTELEDALSEMDDYMPSDDVLLAALGPCGK